MKYSYELTYSNGSKVWSTQDYCFTEEQMLKACKESSNKDFNGVVKVRFHKHIPYGYHLCACGNLAKGTKDELCDECRETYGHTYEHEL